VTIQIDPQFSREMEKYGAFDIKACFNCGNCTAICPLSKCDDSFPRKIIRYSQIGAKEKLLQHRELWMCFYCGECSETCPRQAEPGELMAAARRFAISSYDPTGIASGLFKSKVFTIALLVFLSIAFTAVLLIDHGPMAVATPQLFTFKATTGFLSYDVVHYTGQILMILAAITMLAGIIRMVQKIYPENLKNQPKNWWAAFNSVIKELGKHSSFSECEEDKQTSYILSKRFLHWSIMWGFLGLLLATAINWLLSMLVDKVPGMPISFWHPTRLLGTVAGIFMVYGTGATIVMRTLKPDKYFAHSIFSDWVFVWLLFLAGITGFIVEVAVYLPMGASWMYWALLVHVVISMEVVFLLPFTKFAHAIYRPIALFIYYLSTSTEQNSSS
jgi:nitrate reductase gamma subunit/ferredoxin